MARRHPLEALVARLARRLNTAIWLNAAWPLVATWLACLGTALLFVKMFWADAAPYVPHGLAALPLAFVIAWWSCRGRREFFSDRQLVEVLDHLNADDGAISAAYERPELVGDPEFFDRVEQALRGRLPRLKPMHYGARLLPAAVYFGAALMMPIRATPEQLDEQRVAGMVTQPLLEKLEQNEAILPDAEKEELARALEAIRESDAGVSREQWEAVEEMEQRLDEALERSRATAAGVAGSLSQLEEALSSAGNIAGDTGAQAQADELLRQLEQSLADSRQGLPAKMRRELGGTLKQLARQRDNEALRKKLEQLRKQLSQCKGPGQCDGCGECQGGNRQGDKQGNRPGKGGITRGRGDAELTFGERQQAANAAFKDQELNNQYLSPEDLVDMGITPLEPKVDPGRFQQTQVIRQASQEGDRAARSRITPSQRDVVAKYFSEQE